MGKSMEPVGESVGKILGESAGPAEPEGHRDNVPVLFVDLFSKSRKMSRCFFDCLK